LFARIVDSGSFSRAAERVGLPKSTVSRRIAELESRVGERLLQRTTRKLILTEFGTSLLEHARQLVVEVEAANSVVQHRQAVPSGRLRVSMPSDFATSFLAAHLPDFMQRYPAISLEMDLSPRRVDVLGEGFDLAIRMGDLPDDATLVARRIALFTTALYASPTYIASHAHPEHPDALIDHHTLCILSQSGGAATWTLSRGNQQWQGKPSAHIIANSPDLLVRLANSGLGIVAVPDQYAASYLRTGELVRVLPEWCLPSVAAWAVFPGRRLMPAKTRVFLEMLDAVLVEDNG
ncbi:MAG: LysR family transcriptional regulator, partial [Methylophilaceae bacterium]|nr:LysR family transcriptional regulator [Methylophilaceae bacterium]